MAKNVTFEANAWEDFEYWMLQDPKTFKRICLLLKDIRHNPFAGIGKPEPLKYQNGYWSRRIDKTNRLVYAVNEDTIAVIQCRHHYGDKQS